MVWRVAFEGSLLQTSLMSNFLEELHALHKLCIQGCLSKKPRITPITWYPSFPGWIKDNTDEAAASSYGSSGCGVGL